LSDLREHETGYKTQSPQGDSPLLQSDERFRLLIENFTQYAFITVNTKGVIQSWDGGAEKLLQYKREEVVGRNSSLLFTAQDVRRGMDIVEMRNAEERGYAEDERWHVRKDGSTFWGSGIMVPIYTKEKLIGFGKIFRDRTLQTEHERRKDDFVGIAGHELRNPLSVLKNNIELALLMPEVNNNPTLATLHKTMNERVDRLSHLVNDLLDVSKIASGQLKPKKELINLKSLIEEVVKDYQSMNIAHTIVLFGGEDTKVMADKEQIIQVLNNLIGNAIKYSPEGSRIEVSLFNRLEHAFISVRDHGPGIPEDKKEKIFDRFYRIGNKQRAAEGLGIGLYVCLEIIKAHGGTIGVEDPEGEGAIFYFTLPKNRTF
jgi:PAS domain S-box-containing protein